MEDTAILQTLQTAVIAAVAAYDPAMPIKAEGRTLDQVNGSLPTTYVEIVFIPNNRRGDFWGNEKNYRGMLRIILHYPQDDAGAYPPMLALAAICTPFDNGAVFGAVQIYGAADFMGKVEQGHETLYPASLLYQSYHKGT